MDIFFALAIVVAALMALKGLFAESSGGDRADGVPQTGGRSVREPIPKGYQIYQAGLIVAGISFKKENAAKFFASSNHALEFKRDPANQYDKNAIEVIGVCDAGRYPIGYVEAALAKYLVDRSLEGVVRPRLMRVYSGADGYMEVSYQVIGPRAEKHRYDV